MQHRGTVLEALGDLPRLLTAHLQLSLFALLLGVAISVPLGALASRSRRLERLAMAGASVLQTVPSLALLALMVPLLAALGLRSIGFLPAFVALVLYSVFPVLHGTVVGLRGVDAAVREAARAVGMDDWQQLLRVELPLALPVIVAGVRTACVWTVGAATLATPVGADSLGNYIFSGLQTRNVTAVLIGCAASAALALMLDGLGRFLLVGVQRRSRRAWGAGALAFAALYLYAGATLAWRAPHGRGVLTIGAKTFAEQYVLSEALALEIRRATGVPATARRSLGSSVAFDALRTGAIDAYVDYTGTIWTTVMKRPEGGISRAQMRREIESYLLREHGIHVLASLGFENTYALALPRESSARFKLHSISDLARESPRLSIAGDYEFFARPEWRALVSRYGLLFERERPMDAALMYQAIQTGAVDVVAAFSTDGRLSTGDLVVLADDQKVIPPYDAVVLAGQRLVGQFPEVAACLRALSGRIDADEMRGLNREVAEGRASPARAARRLVERWHGGPFRTNASVN